MTGDTGCGKSTQVPRLLYQYLLKTGQSGKILCVQPRRMAVMNLQSILQKQIPEKNVVGYQIAMKSHIAEGNRVIFMTNGIFLQRLIHGGDLLE